MNAGTWGLAVDLGTSFTSASRFDAERVTPVEVDGSRRIPSSVLLDRSGRLVAGELALRGGAVDPDHVESTPKRAVGRPFILLGGQRVAVADALAAQLTLVGTEASRQAGGRPPDVLVLTHPARWGRDRRAALTEAAAAAGLPEPTLVPEPVAAAYRYLTSRSVGTTVAVYDLGGGTFDTAVVRSTPDGPEVLGEPGGEEELGGESFDHALFRLTLEHLEDRESGITGPLLESTERRWQRAAFDLLGDVRRAKEALSTHQRATVYFALLDTEVDLTRSELEDLIRADVARTVDELGRTIAAAGLAPEEVDAIHLVGGSSRVPLVSRLLRERFGDLLQTYDDPKYVVVDGGAELLASGWRPAPAPPAPEVTDDAVTAPLVTAPPVAAPSWEAEEPPQVDDDPRPAEDPEPEVTAPAPTTNVLPPLPPLPARQADPDGEDSSPDAAVDSSHRRRRPSTVTSLVAGTAVVGVIAATALLVARDGDEDPTDTPTSGATTSPSVGGTSPAFDADYEGTISPDDPQSVRSLFDFFLKYDDDQVVTLDVVVDEPQTDVNRYRAGGEIPAPWWIIECTPEGPLSESEKLYGADCRNRPEVWSLDVEADSPQRDGYDPSTRALRGDFEVTHSGEMSVHLTYVGADEIHEGPATFARDIEADDPQSLDDAFDFFEEQEGEVVDLDIEVDIPPESVSFLDSEPGELATVIELDCVNGEGNLCLEVEHYSLTLIDDPDDIGFDPNYINGPWVVEEAAYVFEDSTLAVTLRRASLDSPSPLMSNAQ